MIKEIKIRKKGFTLLETMMAIIISSGAVFGVAKISIEMNDYLENKNIAKDLLSIIKAVDTRISIDGYNYDYWKLKNAKNHDEILDFISQNFISKYNQKCGVANGWVSKKDDEKNRSFLDCNLWKKSLPYNSKIEFKTKGTEQGFLNNFDIYIDIPITNKNNEEIKHRFKKMNDLYSYFKKNDFANKNGINSFSFIDKKTNENLSKITCSLKKEDCILKLSWNKYGYSQPLKTNGDNSMGLSNVSFILSKTNHDRIKTCLEWEKKGSTWESKQVECGIGLYANNSTSIPISVSLNVDNINAKKIMLTKKCKVYEYKDNKINSFSESPCGIYKDNTNKVVQYIDRANASNMRIEDELYSDTIINHDLINVAQDLYNRTSSSNANLNKLIVNKKSLFKDVVNFIENVVIEGKSNTTEINKLNALNKLNVLENAIFEKDVVVNPTDANPKSLVSIKGTNNAKISPINASSYIPTRNVKIGDACDDKNTLTIQKDVGVVLTCRNDWKNKNELTWQSNYYGEIGVFDGACPTGWNKIPDVHSRFLVGSGKYQEPWMMPKTYKVGDKGGMSNVVLTEEQLPSHGHNSPQIEPICVACHNNLGATKIKHGNSVFSTSEKIQSGKTGSNKGHNNLPNYYTISYCMYGEGDKQSPGIGDATIPKKEWIPYDELKNGWLDSGRFFNCSNNRIEYYLDKTDGITYRYTKADCSLKQEQLVEKQEIEKYTQEIRKTGESYKNYKTLNNVVQVWKEIPPIYVPDWYDIRNLYDCSIAKEWTDGKFYYKQSICFMDQERYRQEREKEMRFGDIRNHGDKIKEERTIKRTFRKRVAAASFDQNLAENGIKVKEGNVGEQKKIKIKIKLDNKFDEAVTFRVNTQDISTTSILAETENLIYDEYGNPFISIVDNQNGGRLMFDGGFPKYYNTSAINNTTTFENLPTQFKFLHNIVKWITKTHSNRKKVLFYGDRVGTGEYQVTNHFNNSIPQVIRLAGYDVVIKDKNSYGFSASNRKINIPLKELNQYAAIIVMSSGHEESLTNKTANNFATYVNNGGGILIITDHNVFQYTGNQILRKFGSEFYGVVDRNPSNNAYKLSTILNKLKGSKYGDGHQLWTGLDRNGSIPAGGSEGNVKLFKPVEDFVGVTEDIVFQPGETEKEIYITINGDNLAEENEDFKIMLSNPSTGIILGNNEIVVSIIDDDKKIRALSSICEKGLLVNDNCIQKKKSPLIKTPVLKSTETINETGFIKINYDEIGDRILKTNISGYSLNTICDKEIKEILNENNKQIIKEFSDSYTELEINNVEITDKETWVSSRLFDKNYKMKKSFCKDFEEGKDVTLFAKMTFKKHVYEIETKCKEGEKIEGACYSEKISSPIENCFLGYKKIENVCVRKN